MLFCCDEKLPSALKVFARFEHAQSTILLPKSGILPQACRISLVHGTRTRKSNCHGEGACCSATIGLRRNDHGPTQEPALASPVP